MSRAKGSLAAPTITNSDGEEQCPICKTLRYMNRNMKFLINKCYHPLCNNCVDRLFENGPNQCPYVHCNLTLRKRQFREPTFADLDVEREVDIRRRVVAIFNQPQDDFEDLRAYNDYLDMVESLTMDLVYGSDAAHATAEEKLKIWEDQNGDTIVRNRRQGERQREQIQKHLAAEQKAAAARRAEAQQQEDAERRAKAVQREAALDALASAPIGNGNKVLLKKRGQERAEAAAEREAAALRRATAAASGEFTIKGLKKRPDAAAIAAARAAIDEERGPYNPFGKVDLKPSRYALLGAYKNNHINMARTDNKVLAGGYRFPEYYSRALFEAFAGLAVFVADEKETKVVGLDFGAVVSAEAGMAADEDAVMRGGGVMRRPADRDGDVSMTDAAAVAAPPPKSRQQHSAPTTAMDVTGSF